ncbi:MAG: hydrogenase 4 subunit B [Solidesulfovibrio sp.]
MKLCYFSALCLFGLGVGSPLFAAKRPALSNVLAHFSAILGSLALIALSLTIFITDSQTLQFSWFAPLGDILVTLDGLSALFLLALGVVGAAASIYAVGYTKEYYGHRFASMASLYNAFLLSIVLVLTVSQVLYFIIAWEVMTLVSFFLVNHEYEKTGNTKAAYQYILMTHVGTAFIVAAFLILSSAVESMDFARLSQAPLPGGLRNLVFLCALIGFGTKAGVMPMHVWLPEAHPAAPSHVSALMSGIMIKTAIYGMCRFFMEFLGAGPQWWGVLVLALAIVSSVLGVLYACVQHDLKRLLAYHSVENIGIILLGVGAGMVFMSRGEPVPAALAWIAALYHVFNHAVFKSLLFLGAGAVLHATGTKDIEHMGGLIKRMPYTAVFFLIGSVAISALPPLSGFVSEWLTFQAMFHLPAAMAGILGKLWTVVLIALLGLTGALAGACFVKVVGVTFLAKPRSVGAEKAREVPANMLIGMAGLAAVCVAAGVYPEWMLLVTGKAIAGIPGLDGASLLAGSNWLHTVLPFGSGGDSLPMPLVAGLVLFGLVMALGFARMAGRPKTVVGETWTCGIIPTARMEYSATGFTEPLRRVFKKILRPVMELRTEKQPNAYHGVKMTFSVHISNIFNDWLYKPLCEGVMYLSENLKRIQGGSLQLYIGYIMVFTVLVLIISNRG